MYCCFKLVDPFPDPAKKSVITMSVVEAKVLKLVFRSESVKRIFELRSAHSNSPAKLFGARGIVSA